MAFTRVWSNLTPLGSASASTVDDEIRNVRVDVQERMDVLLGAGLWAGVVATLSGLKKFIPGFRGSEHRTGLNAGATYTNNTSAKLLQPGAGFRAEIAIPLDLPVGAIITDISAYVANNGFLTDIALSANKVKDDASTNAFGTPSSSSTTGLVTLSLGALAEVITDQYFYHVVISCGDGGAGTGICSVYGIRVTYTKPNIIQ